MNKAKIRRFLKLIGRSFGLEVSVIRDKGQESFPGYVEDEFKVLYKKYCHLSMVPWSGCYSVYRSIDYILKAKIEGDIVECGVWKAGCAAFMMEMLKNRGETGRSIWLYDTFEGMTVPGEKDKHFAGAKFAPDEFEKREKKGEKWSYAPLDLVKDTLSMTGYPDDKVEIVKGDVLQTLKTRTPKKIALLRLDTDWYDSTKMEMESLFPLLIKDGVFLCDDYGAWKGSYDAVHEYFEAQNIKMYLQVDAFYGGACGIKA